MNVTASAVVSIRARYVAERKEDRKKRRKTNVSSTSTFVIFLVK